MSGELSDTPHTLAARRAQRGANLVMRGIVREPPGSRVAKFAGGHFAATPLR